MKITDTDLDMHHLRSASEDSKFVLVLQGQLVQGAEGHAVLLDAEEGDQVGAVRGRDHHRDDQPARHQQRTRRGRRPESSTCSNIFIRMYLNCYPLRRQD